MAFVEPYEAVIHRALLDRVKEHDFPHVVFEQGVLSLAEPIKCRTAVASPILSSWREPLRNRMHRMRERTEWRWELVLKFDRRVNLESFEASLEQEPVVVPRDAQHDRQVTLLIAEARYVHPPHVQPASGTEVVYGFVAELTPV